VYAYVRGLGASAQDAEDVTQGYFARFLEKRVVREVNAEHGRFRSFLFASVRNFLNNERDRERTLKRGGGKRLVSLDVEAAEERWADQPRDPATPETIFLRSWAQTVIARVQESLEREAGRRGGDPHFARLAPYLLGSDAKPPYAEIAREWGRSESAVRVHLHRLRKRFAALLREEIGQTVAEPGEVEDEIRFLRTVLGG
jgi:RNA polymerase sigma-70 factor (ECF subfamily)